jgi:hypothetical protein
MFFRLDTLQFHLVLVVNSSLVLVLKKEKVLKKENNKR